MNKVKNLLKGEIVDFDVCEVISIIENLEFLDINTLCIQKSINGKYFCKVDDITVKKREVNKNE